MCVFLVSGSGEEGLTEARAASESLYREAGAGVVASGALGAAWVSRRPADGFVTGLFCLLKHHLGVLYSAVCDLTESFCLLPAPRALFFVSLALGASLSLHPLILKRSQFFQL